MDKLLPKTFKEDYNYSIKRLFKADRFFEDRSIRDDKKIAFLGEYNALIRQLSFMQNEHKRFTGEEMPLENKFKGF